MVNKSVILDLDGHSVAGGDQFALFMLNNKSADVTIKNGTLSDTTAARGTVYVQWGAVTLENVTINASIRGVGIGPGVQDYCGKAVLNAGTTINATESGVGIFGDNTTNAGCVSELVVNEGVAITSKLYGIAGNGSNDNTKITINGGTITATGGYSAAPDYSAGIYHPQQGTLTINEGTISGGVGVQMAGGTAEITGGTLISTDNEVRNDPFKAAQQGDGMVLDGAALSLVSRSAYGNIDVTVTGGEFQSQTGNQAVRKYGMRKTGTVWEVIKEPTTSKLAVLGGTYSSDVSAYLPEGKKQDVNGTVVEGTDGPKFGDVAEVNGQYFATLQAAIDAVPENGTATIEMIADSNLPVNIPSGKVITLNIPEGVTLSNEGGTNGGSWGNTVLRNSGNLTITGEGTILVKKGTNHALHNYEGAVANLNGCTFMTNTNDYIVWNRGTMTIDGATITGTGNDMTAVYNGWRDGEFNPDRTDYDARLTMKSGSITNVTKGKGAVLNNDWATFIMEGGEVKAPLCVLNWDIAEIKDGTLTVTGEGTRAVYSGVASADYNRCQLTISGGEFNNESTAETVTAINTMNGVRKIEITGGTFFIDVTEYCAEGYVSHHVGDPEGYFNVHTSDMGWIYDADNHWQGCREEGCLERESGPAAHTWNAGEVTTEPTYDVEGVRTFTCTVCEATRTESIDRLTRPSGGGSSGGGGGSRPNPPEVDIQDPDVPLAGGPELNKADHFAYVRGYKDETVRPEQNITREEVATIFYRLLTDLSRTMYETSSNSFTDVESDRWSNTAISTLANAGILKGYQDGTFQPGKNITRAEFAAISARFDNMVEGLENPFSDTVGHWAEDAISFSYSKGWVEGYGDNTFRPQQNITRAEVMKWVNKVLERGVDADGLIADIFCPVDNLDTKWYYYEVLEAANGHEFTRGTGTSAEKWTSLK